MRIQALKTLLDGNVTTKKGTIYQEDEHKARELIAMGYAVHIPEPEESNAAPLVDNGDVDFLAAPAGGPGGLEKPASLSQEAPAQPKLTYKKRAASTKS